MLCLPCLQLLLTTLLAFMIFSINSFSQNIIPEIVKNIQPSIVMIVTYDANDKTLIQGTGFFINKKGDVVSNLHIFEGANKATIKTFNGNTYAITKILANDVEGDLIIVSVNIPMDSVHQLSVKTISPEIGEKVIVIGNPEGLEQTVSDGIVSAVRELKGFGKTIQITAPISPGSSGSPVMDLNGNMVGVATFYVSSGQSLNFAIPSDRVVKLNAVASNGNIDLKNSILYGSLGTPGQLDSILFSNVQDILDLGDQKCLFGKYSEALELYSVAIKKDDKNLKAYYCRAWVYNRISKFEEALFNVNKAIILNSNWAPLYNLRGEIYSNEYNNNKDISQAINDFSKAVDLDTANYEGYFNRACIYSQSGRYENAFSDFKKALLLCPNEEKGHIFSRQCDAHLSAKDTANAIKDLTKAIEYFKKYPSFIFNEDFVKIAHEDRAEIFENWKKYQSAINDYQETIRLIEANKLIDRNRRDLSERNIRQNIALIYHKWGKPDSAVKYLTCLITYDQIHKNDTTIDGENLYYRLRAENYAKLGNKKCAIADYTSAIQKSKYADDILELTAARGDLLFDLKQYDDALIDFQAAHRPFKILNNYIDQSKYSAMIITLCDSLLDTDKFKKIQMLYFYRGKAKVQNKKYTDAVIDLNTFVVLEKKYLKEGKFLLDYIRKENAKIIEAENLIKEAKNK